MPTLLDETVEKVRSLPRWVTLSQVANESGVKLSWLSAFASGLIEDPGVKKVQALHDYLSVLPLNHKPQKLAFRDLRNILPGGRDVPHLCAVYEIWGKSCLYVGSSGNVGRRLREHERRSELLALCPEYVVLTYFEDRENLQMSKLERFKIESLKPVLNVTGKKLDV